MDGNAFWLTSARDYPQEAAEDAIARLVGGEEGVWGVKRRKNLNAGDMICFYVVGKKRFVAHAVVMSPVERRMDARLRSPVEHPWVFDVGEPHIYTDNPISYDRKLREILSPYAVKNPGGYVQGTKQVSEREFRLLTRDL